MKTDPAETDRKYWNAQHAILRRLLVRDKEYQKAIETFLSHHAMVHTAKLHPGSHWSFQDQVLSGLTDEQMRCIPKGGSHSVAWVIWHIARIEDVTMNVLLADSSQVFHRGNWPNKLGITCLKAALCVPLQHMTKGKRLKGVIIY